MGQRNGQRSRWLRIAQIICTLGLIALLWRSIDWGHFAASFVGLRWGFFALAALLTLITHGINIARWRLLLLPTRLPARALISYYGAGIFSNNFLPTGIGGDGVRVALLSRHTVLRRAVWSVAADRALGLLGLLSFGLPGLLFGAPPLLAETLQRAEAIPLGAVLTGALLAALLAAAAWWRWPGLRARAIAGLGRLMPVVGESRAAWLRGILGGYLLSLCAALCLVLTHSCVLLAFDLQISAGAAIWLVVIGSLSLLVPISLNGLGVLESVYVLVLGNYGVAAPAALGVALCIRGLMVGFSLLGGLISLGQGWLAGDAGRDPSLP